jgi:hypothetical protein
LLLEPLGAGRSLPGLRAKPLDSRPEITLLSSLPLCELRRFIDTAVQDGGSPKRLPRGGTGGRYGSFLQEGCGLAAPID